MGKNNGNASQLNAMYNAHFEVYLWPALPFIAPVVSLLRFIVMGRTQKDITGSAAGTASACFSSFIHTRPASPGFKEQITEWLSTVPVVHADIALIYRKIHVLLT